MKQFAGRMLDDRYLLDEYIAAGNFGAVYRGRQLLLGTPCRRVAVKISKATGLDGKSAKELFADAYRLAEAMDEIPGADAHKHLVQILDLGIAEDLEGRGYAVMEYVQGTNLADRFRQYSGGVPANILVSWVTQACRALDGLHRLVPPLLHCDLKPDNILLGMDNAVRLVDFGLSRRMKHTGVAHGGEGVLKYMSPETSQQQQSTPASDVYSIGVVLYEGLTKAFPFDHAVPPPGLPRDLYNGWFDEHRRNIRPDPPSQHNPSVTPELDAVVLRCLQFVPARRYRDAGELLAALLAGPPPRSRCEEAQELAKKLEDEGNFESARRVLEEAAASEREPLECRFQSLARLGALYSKQGDPEGAASVMARAWNLVKDAAVLTTQKERIALVRQIAETYELARNPLQAGRWRRLLETMTRGTGG